MKLLEQMTQKYAEKLRLELLKAKPQKRQSIPDSMPADLVDEGAQIGQHAKNDPK